MKNKLRLLLLVAGVAGFCNSVLGQTVDQGRKFYYYKRFKSAKDVFDKVLASNPNNIDAVYWQGQTLLAMKDSVAAQDLYSKALQTNGNAPMLLAGMAGVELRFGKAQDARQHCEMAIQLTKQKDVNVLNAVARANIDAPQGDLQYALEKLQLATNVKNFNNPETYVLMGDAYRRLIDGGNAVQAYQKALTMDSKLAEAEYQIGKIYLTQNNVDYFLPDFKKAVEMDPAYAPAWYELYYYYYYHWTTDKDNAKEALEKYIANSDPGPDVDFVKIDFKVVNGDFNGAKADAQAALTTYGDKVGARLYKTIAYCCDTLGDNSCAQTNINSYFAKQDPTAVTPLDYVLLATIEGKSPDSTTREKAFVDFGNAIQKDTLAANKTKYLNMATDLANKLGDKMALATLARITYMGIKDPTNSDLFKWGMANYQAGQYQTADSIFCQVYEQKYPDEVYGYLYCMRTKALEDDSIGSKGVAVDAEMKLAEFGRAKDSIAKAAGSKDSTLYKKYVIDCYSRLAFYYNNSKSDRAQAVYWLQKILEVDPENADAKKYIAILTKPVRQPAARPKSGGK
ncbi:MAG TPA: tetratricopeptide repeat protein [Puia sp.]|jgi:tetratricopeptide (TPR) repeat protein|nr:tetratricopeptide repeat protein [Puia sp.]